MALVTVYITTCNRSTLLRRCLTSVQSQSFSDLHIIVIDDNSDDDTQDFMLEASKNDRRITYLRNDRKMGACFSRNRAILLSTSKYITGCDDDDYFKEDRVESFLENRDKLEHYSFLFTDSIWLTKHELRLAKINKITKNEIQYQDLIYFNFIGNQIFIEREKLARYLFDDKMPAWQDLECWYRILKGENKPALKIKAHNYIQDIAHDYGRISTAKREKIFDAYERFSKKNKFGPLELIKLRAHFFNYGFGKKYYIKTTWCILKENISYFNIMLAIRNFRAIIK